MKYILVSGGVISGVGKGIIASSIGTIMKSCGLSVTSIKIDPYLNIDAGTFSPYEHGETERSLHHSGMAAVLNSLVVDDAMQARCSSWTMEGKSIWIWGITSVFWMSLFIVTTT